jgi:4-amino-4-deoxy-L-arabinose transferase-like glycosyltransferase
VIFVAALVARLVGSDVVITADEDNWIRRAGGFTYGLLNGQFGRTYQNGHPGVTAMWVATVTLGPERMVQYADRVHNQRLVGRVAGFWDALVDARRGFAVVTAALVALIAALTWRLSGPGPGLLAGLVVGLEPFYLAISQLVHMDAILSGCMAASVLAALVRWGGGGGCAWIAASGVLAGLALLSKTPALFLVAFVPVLGVVMAATAGREWKSRASDLAIWLLALAVTVVALWPAIWVLGPVEVLDRVSEFTRETGGQPHEAGTFFWGAPRSDPGPLFYPVALAFRLAPITALGVALLALFWRGVPNGERGASLALAAYCVGFLAMMTLGAKKFDRYLLPMFPAIGVLAAIGLWRALVVLAAGRSARGDTAVVGGVAGRALARVSPAVVAAHLAIAALAVWPVATSSPYVLSYYSPLLGGGGVAQRTVMVGNGEGLDQVAAWLNARPSAEDLRVVSHSFDILQPLIVASGEPLRDRVPPDADYVVLYRFQMQIGHSPRVLTEYLGNREPELSVWIDGIEYARVYRGPRQAAGAVDPTVRGPELR